MMSVDAIGIDITIAFIVAYSCGDSYLTLLPPRKIQRKLHISRLTYYCSIKGLPGQERRNVGLQLHRTSLRYRREETKGLGATH